jgi:hypothetical protein
VCLSKPGQVLKVTMYPLTRKKEKEKENEIIKKRES